jgi:hypothetical protein
VSQEEAGVQLLGWGYKSYFNMRLRLRTQIQGDTPLSVGETRCDPEHLHLPISHHSTNAVRCYVTG